MLRYLSKNDLIKDSTIFLGGLIIGGGVVCFLILSTLQAKEHLNANVLYQVSQEMEDIAALKLQADDTFDAVVDKIAALSAQATMMDAKLATMAASFKIPLPMPDEDHFASTYHLGHEQADMNLYAALASMEYRLKQKGQQLQALEDLFRQKILEDKTKLAGTAQIVKGWISSYYGFRIDPLTGKKKYHSGVDIGSHHGREVSAVATGVVTFAGEKGGYGNTLEISHGDGLMTRYGHNQDLLVKEGDIVHQGTPIALVGDTGRATGPHVHFEVREHGLAVNPAKYYPQFSKKT